MTELNSSYLSVLPNGTTLSEETQVLHALHTLTRSDVGLEGSTARQVLDWLVVNQGWRSWETRKAHNLLQKLTTAGKIERTRYHSQIRFKILARSVTRSKSAVEGKPATPADAGPEAEERAVTPTPTEKDPANGAKRRSERKQEEEPPRTQPVKRSESRVNQRFALRTEEQFRAASPQRSQSPSDHRKKSAVLGAIDGPGGVEGKAHRRPRTPAESIASTSGSFAGSDVTVDNMRVGRPKSRSQDKEAVDKSQVATKGDAEFDHATGLVKETVEEANIVERGYCCIM